MANTTNFNWETPDDTDLVKDGAAAIRTLGNSIDTSFVDLKGGTTGQILSKASNTDLDYTWITNDVGDITEVTVSSPLTGGGSSGSVNVAIQDGTTAQKGAVQLEDSTSSTSTTKAATPNSVKSSYDLANAAIPKSLIDAEGDLIVGDAADAVQRLAIGTTGQVLTVDTSVDGKIKWAAPAGGGKVLQVVQATTSTQTATSSTTWTDTNLSATITPSSATSKIMVLTNQAFQIQRSTNKVEGGFRLMRDSTRLMGDPDANSPDTIAYEITGASFVYFVNVHNFNYLDSPATTSALTYKTQSALQTTANSAVFLNQPLSLVSSIILLEIGA